MLHFAKAVFLCCLAALPFASFAHSEVKTCPRFEIAVANDTGARTIASHKGGTVRVDRPSLLTTADFTGAHVTLTEGQIVLNIDLTHAAGSRIQAFSREHVGVRLAFILDDRALKVARILDPIHGDGILMGPFERERADALATLINQKMGRCPAP